MLKKLYKYDFRCSARKVLPMFIIYFVITVVFKIMNVLDIKHPIFEASFGVITFIFMLLTFALVFYGFGTAMARFKKNLFTDEGYLMNTLPVKPWQHVTSKLLNAFTWGIFCMIATAIGICLVFFGKGLLGEFSDFVKVVKKFFENANAVEITELILAFCSVLGFIITVSLCAFFWTALESSFPYLKKRWIAVASGIITFFVLTVGSIFYEMLIEGFADMFEITEIWKGVFSMAVSILIMIILSVVFFIGTCKLMEKKLNLE